MIEYVEVGLGGRKAAVRLTNVVFVTGTGKSTFLKLVYGVLSSVGKRLPKLGIEWSFYAQSGEVIYSITAARNRVRQTISTQGEEIAFEFVPAKGAHRLIKPIDIAVTDADVVMPEVKTKEHVSVVADEDIERLNSLLLTARKAFSIKAQFLGPYISPRSLVDASTKQINALERHGRNLAAVLSNLALYNPSAYDSIRTAFRKLGFSISVGLAKPGFVGVIVSTKRGKMPLSKAPCSIKSLLAIAVALELKPDLLLIDNLDYCLTKNTAEALAAILRQKSTKVIAEIHNSEVVDWFNLPNKSVVELML
ncbi:ABC transporter ATP-binding protein [Pyrobaculum aerophilum]|uniref:Uncharacterized protein n=1 Tax=Pyrobaculum aerophilum TaxID=13773 RepID=A0A371QXE9_9CREN|nr:ABC transporter ATP-binding protein [Pyrobaculum aerophilum]RFA95009.1 hypothetical protein CGL51_08460 [Pyrobaculum aerophilum]